MAKPGKKTKSGDIKAVSSNTQKDNNWSSLSFEEESWNPCLALIVGRQPDDFKHIEALNIITQTGLRRLFSVVTKEQLFNELKDFGNSKALKKPKDALVSNELFDSAKQYLDDNEGIPTKLLAKLIKNKLLAMKEADKKHKDADAKISSDKKKRAESAKSPKRGKKTPEPVVAKENSKLRKRGEEDDNNKCIDDEPDDGASHYYLLSGFHDPYLLPALEELGVYITCVIGVSTQDGENKLGGTEVPIKEPISQSEDVKKELDEFWKGLQPILQGMPSTSRLYDMALLDYEVKSLTVPTDANDAEQKVQYSTALFEDIAVMLYDLLDAKRLFGTFKENLKLINVPLLGEHVETSHKDTGHTGHTPGIEDQEHRTSSTKTHKSRDKQVDMRFYNDLMSSVPHESVSVSLIMHCMLEQIVATEEGKVPPSERPPPVRADGINSSLASYLTDVAAKLGLSEQEHKELSEVLDLPQHPADLPAPPLLVNIHDDICIRTNHLKPYYEFDPAAVEKVMLQFLPFAHLYKHKPLSGTDMNERAVKLQELIHYCASDGLTKSEIDRAFKQFVFEGMDLATTDQNGFMLEKEKEGLPHTPIPWDDPYPFFKVMVPVMVSMQSSHETENKVAITDVEGNCTNRTRISSQESKKGILTNHQMSASSIKRSRSNSVHFDVPLDGEESEADFLDSTDRLGKTFEESLVKMIDIQQRNLDQWCFAEHFKPEVLQQVLYEASYYLPVKDVYHHKRDNSLMLVLHNPHSREFQNHMDWHKELHSDMGFRNYLEYTADTITDWLKEKNAEYQAKLLSKEVSAIHKEEAEKAREAEKAEKAKRVKSPQRSASRSRSPGKSPSSERVASATNPYIREGSLKAQLAEKERLAAEEEKAKEAKRAKSATAAKSKIKQPPVEVKEEKNKAERSSRASLRSSQTKLIAEQESSVSVPNVQTEVFQAEDKFWPFYGYNTGNQLIHVAGITTTLFPSDGGQIKTERTEFVNGTTSVRSVVLKDGHVFAVHLLNPIENPDGPQKTEQKPEEAPEPPEGEVPGVKLNPDLEAENSASDEGTLVETVEPASVAEFKPGERAHEAKSELRPGRSEIKAKRSPVSKFGSITCLLSDGMNLAFSQFGSNGESGIKLFEPPPSLPHPPSVRDSGPNPIPSPSGQRSRNSKKFEKADSDKVLSEDTVLEEPKKEEEPPQLKQEFQEIYITCPDGLHVSYFLQSSVGVVPPEPDVYQLVVRQSYPFKTNGVQPCEAHRHKIMSTEVSRCLTHNGDVIKNMADGSVEVLSADGTVSVFRGEWGTDFTRPPSMESSNLEATLRKSKSTLKEFKMEEASESEVNVHQSLPYWVITYPNGERMQVSKSLGSKELPHVPISLVSDPDTQQTMATRDDHVVTISFPDGMTIVEHADGTRITIYYRETPIILDDDGSKAELALATYKFIKVECPGFATVEFNCETSENLTVFASGSSLNVFPDGYYILHHAKGGRIEVDVDASMVYFPRRNNFSTPVFQDRELQYVLRHNADIIVETVDPEGNIFHVRSTGDFNVVPAHGEDSLSEYSEQNAPKEKKVTVYNQHAPRFFIIHADGSGTELLRYQDIAEYLAMAEHNPAAPVMKETIPDHPGCVGITILKPYLLDLSEKWFKKYDQESIIPSGIRCRDLTALPPKEYKKPGPKFGTNVGKGLSIGGLTKGPPRIPILKCPSKLELRQLVQYKPMTEQLRNKLRNGVLKYSEAVVARMRADNLMAVTDPRDEGEKLAAAELKRHVDSEKLKEAAESDKPKEFDPDHVKSIYEQAVAPKPATPPPIHHQKRTSADCEQERREMEEEKENKQKIKNHEIEPYFRSEIGKAFLLTQANDVDEMMRQLTEDRIQRGSVNDRNSEMSFSSEVDSTKNNNESQQSDHPSSATHTTNNQKTARDTPMSSAGDTSEVIAITPSDGLRPHNPTPAHATGQGSPSPVRPENPTPAQAGSDQKDKSAVSVISQLVHANPLTTNVIGQVRSEHVPIPVSIKGGRQGAQPNLRFKEIEDPVRRQVKTSLTVGATPKGQKLLSDMRGLICYPEGVDFGVLKEGCTYAYNVYLKNTGVDACRFKVIPPPPATGLRVIFKPGPVAAGMSATLTLELYAIANGVEGESGVGRLGHVLEIVTETHTLGVPIVASILTANEYDNDSTAKETTARLISTKPPALTGIIRPRKDLRISVT
ncbi:unnamed protein product [Lymnaea stagnalis]|uniref:Sperm-associated antigen 17 n=1 Tax=Lymnaea stagnalis TaxID=6523 RepID=A0AAV2IGJ5_LYMST